MTKNVLAYLKKVVDAKNIRFDDDGENLSNITYVSQDGKTYQATINSHHLSELLYENHNDYFKETIVKKYGPLNLSKILEFVEIKHPRYLTKDLQYIPVEKQII